MHKAIVSLLAVAAIVVSTQRIFRDPPADRRMAELEYLLARRAMEEAAALGGRNPVTVITVPADAASRLPMAGKQQRLGLEQTAKRKGLALAWVQLDVLDDFEFTGQMVSKRAFLDALPEQGPAVVISTVGLPALSRSEVKTLLERSLHLVVASVLESPSGTSNPQEFPAVLIVPRDEPLREGTLFERYFIVRSRGAS